MTAEIVEQFKAARGAEYKHLSSDIRRLQAALRSSRDRTRRAAKDLRDLRGRLDAIKAIDFFSAPGGTEAEAALTAFELASRPRTEVTGQRPASDVIDRSLYSRRTWVTRPRPGVDRFASAWLILHFIDPRARFAFASGPTDVRDAVPFDMYDTGFRHEGSHCTFEVLQARFGIDDPIVRRIGEIVHDIDLKEDAYHAPQAPTVAALVEGLRASFSDDAELLRQGIALFHALYEGLKAVAPRSGRIPRSRQR